VAEYGVVTTPRAGPKFAERGVANLGRGQISGGAKRYSFTWEVHGGHGAREMEHAPA